MQLGVCTAGRRRRHCQKACWGCQPAGPSPALLCLRARDHRGVPGHVIVWVTLISHCWGVPSAQGALVDRRPRQGLQPTREELVEGWCRPGPLCLGNILSRLQSFPFHQPPTSNPICSLRPTSSVELPRFSESGAGGCSVAGEGTSILPGTDAPGGHNLLDRCMCSGCSCSGRGEESCDRLGARGCKTLL